MAIIAAFAELEELKQIKLEKLRAEVQIGLVKLCSGEVCELDESGLRKLINLIKSASRK